MYLDCAASRVVCAAAKVLCCIEATEITRFKRKEGIFATMKEIGCGLSATECGVNDA
jgi:hypothetical protein